jgi:hypothetical protein
MKMSANIASSLYLMRAETAGVNGPDITGAARHIGVARRHHQTNHSNNPPRFFPMMDCHAPDEICAKIILTTGLRPLAGCCRSEVLPPQKKVSNADGTDEEQVSCRQHWAI